MARGPLTADAHPWIVRATHWLNAVLLGIMIASGLEIFAAFPSFGQKIPETRLLETPAFLRLGGWLGVELVERLGISVDENANPDAPSSLAASR